MKKIFGFAILAVAAIAMASCGNKANGGNGADSTATDSVATAEVKDDPRVVETSIFSFTIPEGWEKNGKNSERQANLKTSNTVPQYYVNVDIKSYIDNIDKWKKEMSKDFKPAAAITVGDLTYEVMTNKGAFYNVNGAALLGEDKGAITFDFTGDGDKDEQEQLDLLKKVLEAVKLK